MFLSGVTIVIFYDYDEIIIYIQTNDNLECTRESYMNFDSVDSCSININLILQKKKEFKG